MQGGRAKDSGVPEPRCGGDQRKIAEGVRGVRVKVSQITHKHLMFGEAIKN